MRYLANDELWRSNYDDFLGILEIGILRIIGLVGTIENVETSRDEGLFYIFAFELDFDYLFCTKLLNLLNLFLCLILN